MCSMVVPRRPSGAPIKLASRPPLGPAYLFDKKLCVKHGMLLSKVSRWCTPYETLKMATPTNAELLKLCGPRDPYPGALGVVKEGAIAYLLLVDGNPLEDLNPTQTIILCVL
jgi:imidazolonepropionase-like amidohydrolase